MNKLQFKKFYQTLRIASKNNTTLPDEVFYQLDSFMINQLVKDRLKTSKNNAIYKAMISADNLLKNYIDKDSRSLFLYGRYTKIFNY